MPAAGLAPAGTSPAGLPQAAPGASLATVVLPDPTTGLAQPCRRIDPAGGDYVFTSDGRVEGMTAAQQGMLLAMKTVLGSAADGALGQDFSTLQTKGPDYTRQVSTRINAAATRLVAAGLVEIVDIQVANLANPDGGVAVVRWRDLSTGTLQTNSVG